MAARDTALSALIACRRQAAWSDGILKEYIARDRLDKRDAALCTRLCYGVQQNRMLLDHYIDGLLTGGNRKLQPIVREILRLGLYQLLFMDKIPESAAVNEAVKQARKHANPSASGLVNGVLRKAAREKECFALPQDLSLRYSCPEDLTKLLTAYCGEEEIEAVLAANNASPDTVIQVNTLKATVVQVVESLAAQEVSTRPHPWMENCLILSGTGRLEQLNAFRNGWFYVQDAASRLCVKLAGIEAKEGLRVLDCCAAPGGKSFAAYLEMKGKGQVHSCDVHLHKTALIEAGAQRMGFDGIVAYHQDATEDRPEWVESMDVVLTDVPCSGYGIIRKKPDIRYKNPDSMKDLPQLQLQILRNQSRYVRPGGTLMYSTCTLVRRENEGVVEKFLKDHDAFELVPLELPEVFPKNETGMLRLLPGKYDTDGFFIAKLRRVK